MNEWLIAAAVLSGALVPCLAVCLLSCPESGLTALQLGGVLGCTVLMLLAQGYDRQPFILVAMVLAFMTIVGSLFFARMMERDL
jgi:multisubunit Na+/H+ antiporter MnhF subunit